MKKIVITGGLGYIGTELCKLYSGETRTTDITVVDTLFSASKVKQLKRWGFNFKQCSILDKECISEIVKDADIVIHLAGITDVAYTNTESMPEKDKLIVETGVTGTQNILNAMKDTCKIIFPSTHVVFEGFNKTYAGITEEESPCPVLSYATSKFRSEEDIKSSGKNYIILRLASVCGYSDNDTMRINIMPNLFASKAAQKETIKLFSGGVQLKSLVPLLDVVRCMKFMAENDIEKETFHVSLESMSVKEVANICKLYVPDLNIVETEDEIPNLGYTISNAKLLSTGFQFRYNIEDCIEEMIENWSNQNIPAQLEYIDKGGNEYIDSRGKITNYELTEPINLIGLIDSNYGSVRANHYHPIQEQKCLLVFGQYISVTKDLLIENAPIETKVINEGDIAIIKPNVAHAMVFTQRSLFLNLVNGEREHENYGITHTIPYQLVDEKMKQDILKHYLPECRICGSKNIQRVVSLGFSPLANNLISSIDENVDSYPLEMDRCLDCYNAQLSMVVPPQKMFDDYLYLSSTSPVFVNHFKRAAEEYVEEFSLDQSSLVVDIGCNDGTALKPFKEKKIRVVGVEPAENIVKIARENGIVVQHSYFNEKSVDTIVALFGSADLVLASNVFAHSDKVSDILRNAFSLLKPKGTFVIEVQYLLNTLEDATFDNIYHEHVNYWTVTSLNNFLKDSCYELYKVKGINTHGGSIRVYIRRFSNDPIDDSVQQFLDKEEKCGIKDEAIYRNFESEIQQIRFNVRKNINSIKAENKRIVAYGSPAKATTALNFFGITSNDIEYTIEDNKLKHDKFIPGVNIPIKNKEYALENPPDVIVVLAWNFIDSIIENNQELVEKGVRFLSIRDLYGDDYD